MLCSHIPIWLCYLSCEKTTTRAHFMHNFSLANLHCKDVIATKFYICHKSYQRYTWTKTTGTHNGNCTHWIKWVPISKWSQILFRRQEFCFLFSYHLNMACVNEVLRGKQEQFYTYTILLVYWFTIIYLIWRKTSQVCCQNLDIYITKIILKCFVIVCKYLLIHYHMSNIHG